MKRLRTHIASFCIALLAPAQIAGAQDGDAVLSVVIDAENTMQFALEDLDAIPATTVVTSNDFVDEAAVFTGPRLLEFLETLDTDLPTSIMLTAINDYTTEIPIEEIIKYNVILALRKNGTELSRRDKGPIWVIYPMSEHPELRDSIFNERLIWQVVKMEYR